jgi:hypothetical protein
MIAYLSSADYPTGYKFEASLTIPSNFPFSLIPGYDSADLNQNWDIPLPKNCSNLNVEEFSKNGDASSWGKVIKDNHLYLNLRIKNRKPLGPNNWVGVEITCPK